MGTQLTPQQQQALNAQKDDPLRIINPRSHSPYILVPEMDYETGGELLEDDHKQQTLHEVALRNASGRMDETPRSSRSKSIWLTSAQRVLIR